MNRILWRASKGPQAAFLRSTAREVLYGAAVGSGKTDALLVAPLRWVDHPKHRALMMRRIRPNLQEMIDRSLQLYPAAVPGAQWREAESRWRFPSGAIIQMGYAEHEKDILNFKTFEYNFIGIDELTSFTEAMYSFLFTRNRTKSADLPLQIRTATNPGDIGHDWVLNRFIGVEQLGTLREPYKVYIENVDIGEGKIIPLGRQFIPATVWDNDSIPNKDEYIAGMISGMPVEDVAAYVYGRWDQLVGTMFKKPLIVLDGPRMLDSDYVVVRTIDYGIDDHTCVLWLLHYPKANVFDVVSELYVREMTLDGLAHLIKARELELKLRPVMYSVGSPEMLNRKPSLEGENQSIASMLTMKGIVVEMGNKDRKAGWTKIMDLTGAAAMRIWPQDALGHGSPNLVRTLPKLQRNSGPGKDPNDIRPRQEDHCLIAGTQITTLRGNIPIEQVVRNDCVLTRAGWRRILASNQTGTNVDIVRLSHSWGELTGTTNHQIWTQNRGFIALDKLRYGDILLSCKSNENFSTESHLGAILTRQDGQIGCISDHRQNTFGKALVRCIKKFGKPLMEIFRPDSTYTTKTTTHWTTGLKTWNVLKAGHIFATMEPKAESPISESIWQRFANWLLNGIAVQKAWLGTVKMASALGNNVQAFAAFVHIARNHLMISVTEPNFVLVPVRVHGGEDSIATMLKESAVFVKNRLTPTNMKKRRLVPENAPVVLKVELNGKADVFNLTVEDQPEFYANGILVHNCADALRYGVMAVIGLPTADTPVGKQERDPTRFDVQFDRIVESATKSQQTNYFEGLGSWD